MSAGCGLFAHFSWRRQRGVDLRQTGTGQDGVRFGSKLMSKINFLANGVSGSDYKPTDQHLAAAKVIADEVKKVQALVDALRGHRCCRRSSTPIRR